MDQNDIDQTTQMKTIDDIKLDTPDRLMSLKKEDLHACFRQL